MHDETLMQLHGGRVARQPNRHRGILYSPVSMETEDGSQVRSGLSAGGSRIRTLGPALGTHRSEPSAASCRLGDPSPSLRQNGMLVMPTALLPPWNAIGVAV